MLISILVMRKMFRISLCLLLINFISCSSDDNSEFPSFGIMEANFDGKRIRLNVDNSINLKNFQTSKKYVPISERDIKNYIKNTLSKKQLSYELDEDVKEEELFNLAKKAHIRYLNKIEDIKIELNSNILIKVLEKYIFIDNKSSKISLIDKNTIHSMNNYILYTLNPKLLKKILMGPRYAHWNNAEIGSHIKFFRKPDIFDRRIYNAICYFHI